MERPLYSVYMTHNWGLVKFLFLVIHHEVTYLAEKQMIIIIIYKNVEKILRLIPTWIPVFFAEVKNR